MKGVPRARHYGISKQRQQSGFTIVETLIVLAVTLVVFLTVVTSISGRQNKTEFSQGINDAQNQIQQIISEVSTNYYPNGGQFRCQRAGNALSITAGSAAQGTNQGCIFIGKVIQFGPDTSREQLIIYSLAALRKSASDTSQESSTLRSARPLAIARGNNPSVTSEVDSATVSRSMLPIAAISLPQSVPWHLWLIWLAMASQVC